MTAYYQCCCCFHLQPKQTQFQPTWSCVRHFVYVLCMRDIRRELEPEKTVYFLINQKRSKPELGFAYVATSTEKRFSKHEIFIIELRPWVLCSHHITLGDQIVNQKNCVVEQIQCMLVDNCHAILIQSHVCYKTIDFPVKRINLLPNQKKISNFIWIFSFKYQKSYCSTLHFYSIAAANMKGVLFFYTPNQTIDCFVLLFICTMCSDTDYWEQIKRMLFVFHLFAYSFRLLLFLCAIFLRLCMSHEKRAIECTITCLSLWH